MYLKLLFMTLFFFLLPSAWGQTKTELQNALSTGQTFLLTQQANTGAFQDSTNALFNVWETILVCQALDKTSNSSAIQKGIDWLKLNENRDGLICHNSQCTSSYCIETSALYFSLLHQNGVSIDSNSIKKIYSLQQQNGSWLVGNPDVSTEINFPSATGFVVNLFKELNSENKGQTSAIEFLLSKQQSDGSWGRTWEYYNTPAYALWQIFPLLEDDQTCIEAKKLAKTYILSSQKADGSWYSVDDPSKHHVSASLQTSMMLLAIANSSDPELTTAFKKGIRFLLQQQLSNGAWEGGFFPIPNERYKKREYIAATALAIRALQIAIANED
jgi:squalene cyclase